MSCSPASERPSPSLQPRDRRSPPTPDPFEWRTIASPVDAPASTWQALDHSASTRYVRFLIENPRGLPVIGYLCDVQIVG